MNYTKYSIVGVLVVIALAMGYFYFTHNDRVTADISDGVIDELPDGVEVIMGEEGRVLRDEKNGVEIPLEEGWTVESPTNYTRIIVNNDEVKGQFTSSFNISQNDIDENNIEKEVQYWLQIQNETCEGCYQKVDRLVINDIEVFVIKDMVAVGEHLNYLFIQNGYLYDLFTINLSLNKVKDIIINSNFDI